MHESAPDDVVDIRPPTLAERFRARLREPPSHWITRFTLLRLLGLVYLFAFLSLANQVLPLIGEDGLLPAARLLDEVGAELGSSWAGFRAAPSIFWIGAPDWALQAFAWVGVALSIAVLLGYANAILLGVLWALYFSYVTIGQDFYGYGWETQLCETGLLAIFLVPLLDGRPFPRRRPPVLVILLFRWLVLRLMLGAGLIKLRGDPCWAELTCLDHHFETQPLPNPLSRTMHFLPHGFHATGVVANHIAELLAPLFVFGPRRARHIAGMIMLAFQISLIITGNLSFLNWLSIVAIVACFDDDILARAWPRAIRARAERARAAAEPSRGQRRAVLALVAIYTLLSFPALFNLMSSEQKMNYSFNRLHIASAYGAFGSMTPERYEVVLEGTLDDTPGEHSEWREYQFPCKPGDPMRRPCVAAPYQFRLDWQIWFAPGYPYDHPQVRWIVHLVLKLLRGERGVLSLLEGNPFPERPPRYIRALFYRYRFADPDDPSGAWWDRQPTGIWFGPWNVDDLEMRDILWGYDMLPDAAVPLAPD